MSNTSVILGQVKWLLVSKDPIYESSFDHNPHPLAMDRMGDEVNPELETFRKEWKEEVIARSKGPSSGLNQKFARPPGPPKLADAAVELKPSTHLGPSRIDDAAYGTIETRYYHDLEDKDEARKLGGEGEGIRPSNRATQEPSSALEHYEQAVERESQGNLGDSLKLYRKAYRVRKFRPRFSVNAMLTPSPA